VLLVCFSKLFQITLVGFITPLLVQVYMPIFEISNSRINF